MAFNLGDLARMMNGTRGRGGEQPKTVHVKIVGPDYQPNTSCQILQVEDLVQRSADTYQGYMKTLDKLIESIRDFAADAEESGITPDKLTETERIMIEYADKSLDLEGLAALAKGATKTHDEFFCEFKAAMQAPREEDSSDTGDLNNAADLMMQISIKAVDVVRDQYLGLRKMLVELLKMDKAVDMVYYGPGMNEYTVKTK